MQGKNYYLFNPGRMERNDNTLKFIPTAQEGVSQPAKYLPIEGVNSLYIFGSVDANSALYNFLGREGISVHFFDYYEHYTGSFNPKEYLLAGKMQIQQTKAYLSAKKRQHIAKALLDGAAHNMVKNLKYYDHRKTDLQFQIEKIETLQASIYETEDIPTLMGTEGNIRILYYQAFEHIIEGFTMNERSKQPPSNEVNALISFGNMMMYTSVLDQIYHTQLNPTISFLHEPGFRRYSLSLDIAEIFKPIIVDKLIFRLCNKKEIQEKHFDKRLNGCYLNETGKKIFIKAFEERCNETIQHKTLGKKVSYKYLIRLECYKLAKYLLEVDKAYLPLKMYW